MKHEITLDPQNWDSLRGHEEAICEDGEVAEDLFEDKREAFEIGWYLGSMRRREEETKGDQTEPSTWGPIALYGLESPYRRVLFLELMAWAILRVEGFNTEKEARAFFKELRQTREDHWGEHPWRYAAKGSASYLNHVRDMADVFANAHYPDVSYPNRKKQPLEQ